MHPEKGNRSAAPLAGTGLVFAAAGAVRLIYFFVKGAGTSGDAADYLKIASNLYNFGAYSLADAAPYEPTLRRAPFYPFFLSFWQWAAGGEIPLAAIAVFQCALDALVAVFVYLLARRVVADRLAVGAALFYTLHPGAISSTNLILTENVFTFLLAAGVFALTAAAEREKKTLFAASGLLFALAVLCRPIAVVFPIFLVLFVLLRSQSKKKHLCAVVFGAVFLSALVPWLGRCYGVAGRFVFVHNISAFQLYLPTRYDLDQRNEAQLFATATDPGTDDEYFRQITRARTFEEFHEADRTGYRKAWENVRRDPAAYLASRARTYPYLFLTSFDRFTNLNASLGSVSAERRLAAFAAKIALLIFFALLPFALAFVGLAGSGRHAAAGLCAVLWLVTMLVHIPMWIEYRFWVPAIPFQVVSAIVGVELLRRKIKGAGA